MWLVRWIVLLLIVVVVLGFSLQNQAEMVNVHLLNWESGPIPLYLALFVSFGFGMVSFLLIAVFQQLQTLSDLGKERRNRKKMQVEYEEMKNKIDASEDKVELLESEKSRLLRDVAVLEEKLTGTENELQEVQKALPDVPDETVEEE